MKLVPALLASFVLGIPTLAQQPAAGAPPTTAKGPFVLPPGETKLEVLMNTSAAYLGCNILWEAREVAGADVEPVRLQQPISTDREGCLEFLAASLHRAGFALTWASEKTGTLEAVNMSGPRGRDVFARAQSRTEAEVLAHPTLAMPVTTTVALQHINPMIATNALRPLFASVGGPRSTMTVGATGGNAVLITGMQTQVAAAIRVLRESDQPPAAAQPPADVQKRIDELEKRVKELEARLAAAGK